MVVNCLFGRGILLKTFPNLVASTPESEKFFFGGGVPKNHFEGGQCCLRGHVPLPLGYARSVPQWVMLDG